MLRPTHFPVATVIRTKFKLSRNLRILSTICLFAGLVTAAMASTPVTVIVGGKPVPFVVSPFLDSDGQVYIPVDLVRAMGGSYQPNPDGKTVEITPATGAAFGVPFQFVDSRFCVALRNYADQLGATVYWDAPSRTMTFRAKLLMVHADSSGLTVSTSYPVYYKVEKLDKSGRQDPERRVYVDLYGVDLGASPAAIPSTDPQIAYIRTGNIPGGGVRVVVDLRHRLAYRVDSPESTTQVHVAMTGLSQTPRVAAAPRPGRLPIPPTSVVPVAPMPVTVPITPPTQTSASIPPVVTAQSDTVTPGAAPIITGISYNVVSPEVTEVVVKTSSLTKYRWITLQDPYRLAFDLAGAGLGPDLPATQPASSPIVKSLRAGTIDAGKAEFGRVVIDLAQAVDFSVTTQQADDGVTYTISLQRPAVIDAAALPPLGDELKGQIIMVDPGHGADDTGAVDTVGGYREKDFTLQIGKKLRDTLARHGATVYMTREDDIKPSLATRPKMAVAVGANFFISIHCDESGARDSHAGTTVYYHAQNPVCRQLAMNIVNRVGAVSGLSANGVKSDTIRFRTGFAVLRNSPMPAVLVECGYMNNSADVAKLRTDEVQQHIAEGITAGLIDFIKAHG